MSVDRRTLCSDVEVEPLPGTAKQAGVYVLFEYPGPWSHDILDGDTFGAELTARLKAKMKEAGASLQLIRHPTREGRAIDDHHLYIVFSDIGVTEVLHVDGPEAILDLDLSGPGKNGGQTRIAPLLLVCTHAKRDRCCAVKGRPLVSELERRYPFKKTGDVVWETSHVKGHRFAPALLLMPWGYSFGRMNLEATEAMLAAAMRAQYFVPGNRGRGTLTPPEQAAEIAVAAHLQREGGEVAYGQLSVDHSEVGENTASISLLDASSARTFTVSLRKEEAAGVVSSCGDEPKTGSYWAVSSVSGA
ncbi:sucrase ferredoxin [Corynebacterium sp. p3-SID1194]|uniref:sucrase ferredoxin n=1 Tax=Corynebacterium sp. p3-SID1194 TaxID=2916105 RepID=UPI0021A62F90|nr:sucrase ferredoxin [Corynebacterium sp. p3-SID1194]MCT1449444.1 sucrase ferredoxin [Corynebacterium sp. p3-SID1194]